MQKVNSILDKKNMLVEHDVSSLCPLQNYYYSTDLTFTFRKLEMLYNKKLKNSNIFNLSIF